MSEHVRDKSEAIIPFAPTPKARPEGNLATDDSGHAIIALLQKAADMAKDDCARAMDVAHKLSFEIRASEERAREAEAEAAHFRDRATRAEAWLLRIHNEVEQTFFQKKERQPRQASSERNFYAQPHAKDDSDPMVENDRAGRRR
jgi:hypothetical protein